MKFEMAIQTLTLLSAPFLSQALQLRGNRDLQGCSFQCPANSDRKPNRRCYDNFDDCQCVSGFIKQGQRCVRTGGGGTDQCSFQCPANSERKPNRSCYDNFDDCDCNSGFIKQGQLCVRTVDGTIREIFQTVRRDQCSFQCPANSKRKPNRSCYDNFDDCECDAGFVKDGNRCEAVRGGSGGGGKCDIDGAEVFEEAKDVVESFNEVLLIYSDGPTRNSRALQTGLIDGASLFAEAIALGNGALGGKLNFGISVVSFGLGAFGVGGDDTSQEILDELAEINRELDEIKSAIEEGFDDVVQEINEVNAKEEIEELLSSLTNLELLFEDFTADPQEFRERDFINGCRAVNRSPFAIFRELYGHACKDCNAIAGGRKNALFVMDTFVESANKFDGKDAERFRKGFGTTMMSALSRAMYMHSVCIPDKDVSLCGNPVFERQLEEMAFGIVEVAESIQDKGDELADNEEQRKLNCNLKLKQICVRGGSDPGSELEIQVDVNQPSIDNKFRSVIGRETDIPENGCVNVDGTVRVVDASILEESTLRFQVTEVDSGIFSNDNDVVVFTHEHACLDENFSGVKHRTSEGTFEFRFERIE